MMDFEPRQYRYGLSTGLFVDAQERDAQTMTLGGVGQDEQCWAHTLTRRAAHVLWSKITEQLFPDKAPMVAGLASTAPLTAPDSGSLTTHVEVIKANAHYTLVGRVQRTRWIVQVSEAELRRLWAALDVALYPVGWQGRESKPRNMN